MAQQEDLAPEEVPYEGEGEGEAADGEGFGSITWLRGMLQRAPWWYAW